MFRKIIIAVDNDEVLADFITPFLIFYNGAHRTTGVASKFGLIIFGRFFEELKKEWLLKFIIFIEPWLMSYP